MRIRALQSCVRIASFGLILNGCFATLLPEEMVLPGGIPAQYWFSDLDGFGSQLAWSAGGLWTSSDAAGQVFLGDELVLESGFPARGHFPWDQNGSLEVGVSGEGVFDAGGELLVSVPGARHFAAFEGYWAAATPDSVVDSHGQEWALENVRKVAVSGERVAALACDAAECGVFVLGNSVERVGDGDPAGDLAFWAGDLWWGMPDLESEGAAGFVLSENGNVVHGIDGDHLGRRVGGGFAAGSLNLRSQPRRLRIVRLEGGRALALDRAAGSGSVALAAQDGSLGIGVPGWVAKGGAVVVVDAAQLP
jgi:hypothetical protein